MLIKGSLLGSDVTGNIANQRTATSVVDDTDGGLTNDHLVKINSAENLTVAESRIRDADLAKEMMNQRKNSILSQVAQAMLAQANQQPQEVLQLLR